MSEGQDAYWKEHEEENERLAHGVCNASFWKTISFLLAGVIVIIVIMWFYAVGR